MNTIKKGAKAKLSPNASRLLQATQGSAAVLTIEGCVAGVVFLTHDRTGVEFSAYESEIEVLASLDAKIQTLLYQAHIDDYHRAAREGGGGD